MVFGGLITPASQQSEPAEWQLQVGTELDNQWFYYRTIRQIFCEVLGGTMTFYRYLTIDGVRIFYREAGDAAAPVLLLLHGFPASSFMFRDLIVQLSGRFRIIAPDYPGFGYSDGPKAEGPPYGFDFLADIMDRFVEQLGLRK